MLTCVCIMQPTSNLSVQEKRTRTSLIMTGYYQLLRPAVVTVPDCAMNVSLHVLDADDALLDLAFDQIQPTQTCASKSVCRIGNFAVCCYRQLRYRGHGLLCPPLLMPILYVDQKSLYISGQE